MSQVHQCKECQEIFTSRNKLFHHLRSSHVIINTEERIIESQHIVFPKVLHNLPVIDINETSSYDIIRVYEDDNVLVVKKPQGMCTIGNSNERNLATSDELLLTKNLNQKSLIYTKKAIPCHRLDKETGGLVICSKKVQVERHIRYSFYHKLNFKRYRTIVIGKIEEEFGFIDKQCDKKNSLTIFHVVSYTNSLVYGTLTTLDVYPITGRKNQIRKHFQAVGRPILGDKDFIYSTNWPTFNFNRMCLWAIEISFPNPTLDHPCNTVLGKVKEDLRYSDYMENDDSITDVVNVFDTSHSGTSRKRVMNNIDNDISTLRYQYQIKQISKEEFDFYFVAWQKKVEDYEIINVRIDEPEYYEAIRTAHRNQFGLNSNHS